MLNQIFAVWVDNFSPRLFVLSPEGDRLRLVVKLEEYVLACLGMVGIPVYLRLLLRYFDLMEPKYISTPLLFISMALCARIVTDFYMFVGNAIARKCNELSSILLNAYDLEPNRSLSGLDEMNLKISELLLGFYFGLIGAVSGFFVSGAMFYSLLRALGLPENIGSDISYLPAVLLGAVPGAVFGVTTGRLVAHVPEIISKQLETRRLYQQAGAIITLNDLPSNRNQKRYFPPEILGIIHSYLVGIDAQLSARIIKKLIDESNNSICRIVNNKISFFASRYCQPRQRIEDIEDELESTPLLPRYDRKKL